MMLGRSLFSSANTLALAAGQKLDQRYIQLLKDKGYTYTYVEDEGFEDVSPQEVLTETTRRIAESAMETGVELLSAAIQMRHDAVEITHDMVSGEPRVFRIANSEDMSKAVAAIVRDVVDRNIRMVDVFSQVTAATYLYRHSVNVAALSVLIGRQFGFTSRQLRELAMGALLHDFGKVCLGSHMMQPKHRLSEDEYPYFTEHTVFGSLLLQNTDPTMEAERLTVLQHHEQQSGAGYPQGLKSDNSPPSRLLQVQPEMIHPYAEIVAVAEAYDNLISGNGEIDRALNPADALGHIMALSHKRFNQAVCHAFGQILCLFPTGSMVRIEQSAAFGFEGYYAVVKEQGFEPVHPVLILYADPEGTRVRAKTVDFSHDKELKLKLLV